MPEAFPPLKVVLSQPDLIRAGACAEGVEDHRHSRALYDTAYPVQDLIDEFADEADVIEVIEAAAGMRWDSFPSGFWFGNYLHLGDGFRNVGGGAYGSSMWFSAPRGGTGHGEGFYGLTLRGDWPDEGEGEGRHYYFTEHADRVDWRGEPWPVVVCTPPAYKADPEWPYDWASVDA